MFDRCLYYVLVHFILASVLSVSACFYFNSQIALKNLKQGTLIVATEQGPITFNDDIANTPATRAQGLMHRTHLPDKYGMLFVFEKSARHSFWMKNTFISLDIIFLDKEYRIVDIITDIRPDTKKNISPKKDCLYALETIAGTTQKYHIKAGEICRLD